MCACGPPEPARGGKRNRAAAERAPQQAGKRLVCLGTGVTGMWNGHYGQHGVPRFGLTYLNDAGEEYGMRHDGEK